MVKRWLRLVGAVAIVAIVVGACVHYAPALRRHRIVEGLPPMTMGGGPVEAIAGARAVRGVEKAHMLTAATAQPSGHKFDITLRLAGHNKNVFDGWVADLAAGAMTEWLRQPGDRSEEDVLAAASVVNSDGTTEDLGISKAPLGQRFEWTTSVALTQRADSVAVRFGLRVQRVLVLRPIDPALAVTLTEPQGYRPPVGLTIDGLIDALNSSSGPPLEGIYVAVQAPDGSRLVEASRANRFGSGRVTFADGQDIVWSINHG